LYITVTGTVSCHLHHLNKDNMGFYSWQRDTARSCRLLPEDERSCRQGRWSVQPNDNETCTRRLYGPVHVEEGQNTLGWF